MDSLVIAYFLCQGASKALSLCAKTSAASSQDVLMPIVKRSTSIAAWIDALKGLQVHFHIECKAVIAAVSGDFDAQGADFPQAFEGVVGRCRACQRGVSEGVGQAHIDAGCIGNTVTRDTKMRQCSND
jgi:hypothetical protein